MLKFINEKSDRGIFARWFNGNESSNTTALNLVEKYMKKCRCTDFLINVMKQCWEDFDKIPNARISIVLPNGRGIREWEKNLA